MKRILILGGGIGGYCVARGLMKRLGSKEAEVFLVDSRPNLEYQPFLAEVASGAIKPGNIEVPIASNIAGAGFLQATVVSIDSEHKSVLVADAEGVESTLLYDQLVIALGCVTRYLPIPGIEENAMGFKSVDEADSIRKKLVSNIARAAELPKESSERQRLLTFVVIGAGFSGVELFSESLWAAKRLAKNQGIEEHELSFHLIDAADHIIGDLPYERADRIVTELESMGAQVHLGTFCKDASDGVVKTSKGGEYPAGIILWTAGLAPAPCLRDSDLPLTKDGRLRCGADLRVYGDKGLIEGVWGLGDCSQVPDKTGAGLPDGSCAPTAQHATRQAKRLVDNMVAVLRGNEPTDYYHENAGMVGGFGPGQGVFVTGDKKFGFSGPLAWLCHRFYHGLAMPSASSKRAVFADYFDKRNLDIC